MNDNNRNLIIAIALSIGVLLVWQFFVVGPQMDKARQQQLAAQQTQTDTTTSSGGTTTSTGGSGSTTTASGGTSTTTTSGGTSAVSAAAPTMTVAEALAESPRVPIQTDAVTGSINLTGGRIDDLQLNDFHETVNKSSPKITLLSPSGAPAAYFVEYGWIGPADAGPLPGPHTKWTAPAGVTLTQTTPVTLTYDNGAGLVFTRKIAVDDKYMFTVTDTVANQGTAAVDLTPFGRVTRVGPWKNPKHPDQTQNEPPGSGYWILHEGPIGVFGDQGLKEVNYKDVRNDKEQQFKDVTQGWVGFTDKYWAAALVPNQDKPFTGRFVYAEQGTTPIYQADFHGDATTVAPGATASTESHMFAGAKQVGILDTYANTLHIKLFDRLIDWGWFWFFTKPLFYLIDWFYHLFGNFGLAILAVTVVVKGLFFPLANRSYRSMSAMKKVQPEMTRLREVYKDDKVKQQQALMELYKKEKINPLAGCWPMAIQIPVFFSLYKVLFVTIEMRHAPFFGWIHDLSAPDPTHVFNLFGLLPYDPSAIPVIGSFLAIGLWPLIMGVTMFVQMKLNPQQADPTQAMIFTWMPVFFTFMLAAFPAGLVIYWAWNNTLSVTQQYVIMRRSGTEVNLWQNIVGTFRRQPKAATAGAPAKAMAPPVANDDRPLRQPKKKKKSKTEKAQS